MHRNSFATLPGDRIGVAAVTAAANYACWTKRRARRRCTAEGGRAGSAITLEPLHGRGRGR
jgi:hypothetical protein